MLMVSISQFSKKNSKTVLNENKGLKWNKSEGYVENIVHNHWNFWLVSLCNYRMNRNERGGREHKHSLSLNCREKIGWWWFQWWGILTEADQILIFLKTLKTKLFVTFFKKASIAYIWRKNTSLNVYFIIWFVSEKTINTYLN